MGTQLQNLSKVKPITTDWLSRFATQPNQDSVTALNGSIASHNSAVDGFEAAYADAIAGNVAPADAATTATTLASTRLSLAGEAVTLAGQKPAIRVAIRADFASTSVELMSQMTSGCQALNEAVGDPGELQQATTGLGLAMAAAIG